MTVKRIINSAVVWTWINNGFRALSGLIVVPLLFRELSRSELGLSGVLLTISSLSVVFDFGFAPTVDRFISYAMGGARTLQAQGVPDHVEEHTPNYELIWELLLVTRKLYRYLTLILLGIMGICGTIVVEHLIRREHAFHPEFPASISRLAWGLTFLSMLLDVYSNWWVVFLRGLNQVRAAARVSTAATAAKCAISTVLLLKGAGLLSLPIAGLVSSLIQRVYARHRCLQLLPGQPPTRPQVKEHLAAMWPNTWRVGLQLLSTYLVVQLNTLLCASLFHLDGTGPYTYSVQLMNYALTMAMVWTATKWPIISQYQARRDYRVIRRLIQPRLWLQALTFIALGLAVVFIAPGFLHWIGKDKQLLPPRWLFLLMCGSFMDMQMSTFGTLVSTGNRWPFLWNAILTNLLVVALSLILLRCTTLGVGAFIASPILVGSVFNYWYWPRYAARGLNTTLAKLLFTSSGEAVSPASEFIAHS